MIGAASGGAALPATESSGHARLRCNDGSSFGFARQNRVTHFSVSMHMLNEF